MELNATFVLIIATFARWRKWAITKDTKITRRQTGSNLMPIAALTQSIENESAWWRIEPKNSAVFRCFYFPAFRPRRCTENRA